MAAWNKDDIKKLIELYEAHPTLWDVSSVEYKNRLKKQSAYKNIAVKLNKSVGDIAKKIHNLRSQLHQENRRLKNKKSIYGLDENYTSKWEYYDSLKFIIQKDSPSNPSENLFQTIEKEKPSHKASVELEEGQSSQTPFKKCKRKRIDSLCDKLLSKACSVMEKATDEYQVFGDYIASEFRCLKSERHRMLLRRKIQKAIHDVAELEEQEENNANYDVQSTSSFAT